MNKVFLIGRLTKDPDGEKGKKGKTSYCRFNLALNRGKNKDGEDLGADFPNIVCFGTLAENVMEYCEKGKQVAVSGRIQTGSYQNKDKETVYTTDVLAESVEFLGSKSEK